MKDVSTSNSDSNGNGNSDRDSDVSFRNMKQRKEHAKERQEMKQVVSDCRRSKKEQETLKNIKSRKINQKDVVDGVYRASKKEIDLLKVAQQKRHARQKNYLFGDDDTDLTSNN